MVFFKLMPILCLSYFITTLYKVHTDLHLLINFLARMQGMGGTMMAGGMQQRMAVGGNPGKDTHFFFSGRYRLFW